MSVSRQPESLISILTCKRLDGSWNTDPGIDPPLANVILRLPMTALHPHVRRAHPQYAQRSLRRLWTPGAASGDGRRGGTSGKFGRAYLDTPTEIVNNGSVEIWEILNLTADTHPIHFHLVNVQILNRQAFNALLTLAGACRSSFGTLRVYPNRPNSAGRKPCRCIPAR